MLDFKHNQSHRNIIVKRNILDLIVYHGMSPGVAERALTILLLWLGKLFKLELKIDELLQMIWYSKSPSL